MSRVSKKAQKEAEAAFAGRWRIVDMELWDEDAIDLDVEGHLTFSNGRQGDFQFICVRGFMDCRYSGTPEAPRVDFSWEGHDEDTPVSGGGWATIEGDHIEGRIFIQRRRLELSRPPGDEPPRVLIQPADA